MGVIVNRIKNLFVAVAICLMVGIGLVAVPGTAWASTCSQGQDPTCSPGSGWTEVFITHNTSTLSYSVATNGDSLDQAFEEQTCYRDNREYWWYRSINSGTEAQFVQDGVDGNFHVLGFSGGEFKLQSGVGSVGLWFWDQSGGNWSYASDSIGSFFMTSPDSDKTFLEATISVQSHWVVWAAPFPTGNACNTH